MRHPYTYSTHDIKNSSTTNTTISIIFERKRRKSWKNYFAYSTIPNMVTNNSLSFKASSHNYFTT